MMEKKLQITIAGCVLNCRNQAQYDLYLQFKQQCEEELMRQIKIETMAVMCPEEAEDDSDDAKMIMGTAEVVAFRKVWDRWSRGRGGRRRPPKPKPPKPTPSGSKIMETV